MIRSAVCVHMRSVTDDSGKCQRPHRHLTFAHTRSLKAAANLTNLSEPLELHFVLAEQQLHLLQSVLQSQVLLQHLEVQLQGNRQHSPSHAGDKSSICLWSLLGIIPATVCRDRS